ncbi:hypothetical protein [Algoriella sp.]|uniref:hypothetical protein n=1 Tax=Algoriella sp. TaxID=1872434 RepID=UPI001B1890DA|nr:hypothetical protein [Algoriella sp.]MBO6213791.1 hypothetical protein [Algoriella sp.]
MKNFLFFLFPVFLFSQTEKEVISNDVKLDVVNDYYKSPNYFKTSKQDLSLEKSNELVKNNLSYLSALKSTVIISPLNKQDDRIPYKYDDDRIFSENLIRGILQEVFLSKPVRLSK